MTPHGSINAVSAFVLTRAGRPAERDCAESVMENTSARPWGVVGVAYRTINNDYIIYKDTLNSGQTLT